MTVDEALWESLTKEYETAKFEEAREIPTLHVLDAAEVPRLKSGPNRKLILLIGTLISFVLACLLVPVLNHWERMDPEAEPKKLLMEMAGPLKRLRRRTSLDRADNSPAFRL